MTSSDLSAITKTIVPIINLSNYKCFLPILKIIRNAESFQARQDIKAIAGKILILEILDNQDAQINLKKLRAPLAKDRSGSVKQSIRESLSTALHEGVQSYTEITKIIAE